MAEPAQALVPAEKTDIESLAVTEYGMTRQQAEALAKVQGAILLARQFPRNPDTAFGDLAKTAQRYAFADAARYSFPRGKKPVEGDDGRTRWVPNIIEGPSAAFAQELKRAWGNMKSGTRIIAVDDEKITGEAFCWDVETNSERVEEFTSSTRIWRTGDPPKYLNAGIDYEPAPNGWWMLPGHKDYHRQNREAFQNWGNRAERNCILKLIPEWVVKDVLGICEETYKAGNKDADPEAEKKKLIVAFGTLKVDVGELELYFGKQLDKLQPSEIGDLREIYKSISRGDTTWQQWMAAVQETETPEDVRDRKLADAKGMSQPKAKGSQPKKDQPEKKAEDSDSKEESQADKPTAETAAENPYNLSPESFTPDERKLLGRWMESVHGRRNHEQKEKFLLHYEGPREQIIEEAQQWEADQKSKGEQKDMGWG